MIQEVTQIKEGIEQCKATGDMMPKPNFNGEGITVKEIRLRAIGSILYRRKYNVNFDNGDWIQIEYSSRRGDQKIPTAPHYSEVKVTCSDPSLNFTDGWDEKV